MRCVIPASAVSDWQAWAFSEVTAVLILDDPRLQSWWPGYAHAGEYFSRSNYPQLAGLERRLKDLFERRTSYADYEQKAVPLLQAFEPSFPAESAEHNGWLGADFADLHSGRLPPGLAEGLGLSGMDGVLVLGVYKGSPADRDGLMAGDFVTAVGSTQVADGNQFAGVIRAAAAGTTARIAVLRGGERKELRVTLAERGTAAGPGDAWPGFTVTRRGERGVAVGSVTEHSAAATAGLRPGDLVIAANGAAVGALRDFYPALNAAGGRSASVVIERDGSRIRLEL